MAAAAALLVGLPSFSFLPINALCSSFLLETMTIPLEKGLWVVPWRNDRCIAYCISSLISLNGPSYCYYLMYCVHIRNVYSPINTYDSSPIYLVV